MGGGIQFLTLIEQWVSANSVQRLTRFREHIIDIYVLNKSPLICGFS